MTTHRAIFSSQKQKSVTIASLAVMAMMIGVTAGLVSNLPASDPAWRAPTQLSRTHFAPVIVKDQQPEQVTDRIGERQASRLLPCMMPSAWRRDCEASSVKLAAK